MKLKSDFFCNVIKHLMKGFILLSVTAIVIPAAWAAAPPSKKSEPQGRPVVAVPSSQPVTVARRGKVCLRGYCFCMPGNRTGCPAAIVRRISRSNPAPVPTPALALASAPQPAPQADTAASITDRGALVPPPVTNPNPPSTDPGIIPVLNPALLSNPNPTLDLADPGNNQPRDSDSSDLPTSDFHRYIVRVRGISLAQLIRIARGFVASKEDAKKGCVLDSNDKWVMLTAIVPGHNPPTPFNYVYGTIRGISITITDDNLKLLVAEIKKVAPDAEVRTEPDRFMPTR